MLRVGIAGFGFMGRTHYNCWKALQGAEVVAVCDVNPNIEEDTKRAVGNIGDTQEAVDFSSLQLYTDFEKMLADAKLDAVSITLPTYLHPDYSIKALSAEVNVLCEKPMALTAKECERMIAEAERSGKVLQIGHCVRFWPEYAKAKELIDSGKYGKVIGDISTSGRGSHMEHRQLVHGRTTQRRNDPGSAYSRHRLHSVSVWNSACGLQLRGKRRRRSAGTYSNPVAL